MPWNSFYTANSLAIPIIVQKIPLLVATFRSPKKSSSHAAIFIQFASVSSTLSSSLQLAGRYRSKSVYSSSAALSLYSSGSSCANAAKTSLATPSTSKKNFQIPPKNPQNPNKLLKHRAGRRVYYSAWIIQIHSGDFCRHFSTPKH